MRRGTSNGAERLGGWGEDFPGGLLSGADPVLVRTRYHDFRGPAPWRAERRLDRL
jgi:hypothetical protein